MTSKADFTNHIVDLLEGFGSVEVKRMFSGFGIFHQGLMICLVADNCLYLKVDNQSKTEFEAEGATPFSYLKQGKECQLNYYLAPESFFEDTEQTIKWASLAYDAAVRNPNKKTNKNPKIAVNETR